MFTYVYPHITEEMNHTETDVFCQKNVFSCLYKVIAAG